MAYDDAFPQAQWEDSPLTTEQMTLAEVACHFENYTGAKSSLPKTGDVREEAQLLMSLLSSQPLSQKLSFDEEADPWMRCRDYSEQDSATSLGSFSFACPALSLERNYKDDSTSPSTSKAGTNGDFNPSPESPSPPPAVLLARSLNSEDPDALQASGEALGRNVLRSFYKALEWRTKVWTNSLSRKLVVKEQELKAEGATEQDLRELLKTTEARVIASLREAASKTELIAARTSFRVLPQRINRGDDAFAPPAKKSKVEVASLLTTETSYTYRVSHALAFETVIDLQTPAGYVEVTIAAPGIIEGTFLSSDDGSEELTDVNIQIDTHVLATMMERSSRVVVKASSEALLQSQASTESEVPEMAKTVEAPEAGFTSPQPYASKDDNTESARAAVVTPRYPSPPSSYLGDSDFETTDRPVYFPLPENLDDDGPIRMVSPQPRSPDMVAMQFAPRTPMKTKFTVPTLVSPRSTKGVSQQGTSLLPREAPLFPTLVEAACAAMQHAC